MGVPAGCGSKADTYGGLKKGTAVSAVNPQIKSIPFKKRAN
jgi:hypothetical protein